MTWTLRFLLGAATLLTGCASTTGGVDSVVGSSLSSPNTLRAVQPTERPPPSLNQALTDGAPSTTVSAYEYLLVTANLTLGVQCGPELGSTSVWRALSVLVQDGRSAMLWDLSARASSPESRAAAVIGLAKLRTISHADGRDLLCHMPGTVAVCKGSTRQQRLPEHVAAFISEPLAGESSELSMP